MHLFMRFEKAHLRGRDRRAAAYMGEFKLALREQSIHQMIIAA